MKQKIKVVIYILLVLLAISCLFYELHLCKNVATKDQIAYHKEANINYVTNLKDNKFYNSSYLKDDYNFVASLINNFQIDFTYLYSLSEKIDYVLTYDVTAVLEVYDSDNKDKPIEKNQYELVPKTTNSGSGQIVNVNVLNQIIDYQTYNRIVQDWKREVSPEANLTVYFNVNWTGNAGEYALSDKQTLDLKIPISQKTISISKPSNVSEDKKIAKQKKLSIPAIITIASTCVLIITLLLRLVLLIIGLNKNKDSYIVEINKILRKYDRAITEAKGTFKKESKLNNIEVNSFLELMDVHDNLNVPIIFYKDSDSKATFVVRDDKTVYYCVIKREKNVK